MIRKYKNFLKEEVDVRGNKGISDDFISKSDEEARRNLNIRIDDESQMRTIFPRFMTLQNTYNRLYRTNENGNRLSTNELNRRKTQLEDLAKEVIMDEFKELLNVGVKPIKFEIILVDMGKVNDELPDITDTPEMPEMPDTPEDDKDNSEDDKDNSEEEPNEEIELAIDKKKILNMITQAAGKSTKDIIKVSNIVENGLKEIFGRTWREFLNTCGEISDVADQMDWVVPIDRKANMMSNQPGGMAGSTQLLWENRQLILEKEPKTIVIKAVGVDFPMLIHEGIKGFYLFLQSSAIKKDKETAKLIKKATSSFLDEAQDFRYGPPCLQILVNFVNMFPESKEIKRLDSMVFSILSIDKKRSKSEYEEAQKEYKDYLKNKHEIALTDSEFLKTMKSILSTSELKQIGGRQHFDINKDKFQKSEAKKTIQKIIDFISDDIKDYNKKMDEYNKSLMEYEMKLSEWERRQSEKKRKEEFKSKFNLNQPIKEPETKKEIDYSKLSQKELTDMIDKAFNDKDEDLVNTLLSYIKVKECRDIYSMELKRINEINKYKKNKIK
jgi:hypothetical protein